MTYRNLLGAMDRKVSPRQVADYTLAHESGHMVQYNEDPNTLGGSSIVEQQADCLGGVALSTIAPADIVVAPEFYSGLDGHGVLGTDLSHGTIQDRINMFRLGATDPVAC
jgi:predicted metalloprotease